MSLVLPNLKLFGGFVYIGPLGLVRDHIAAFPQRQEKRTKPSCTSG